MATSVRPFCLVALSACVYSLLFRTLCGSNLSSTTTDVRSRIKAISAGHATLTTLLAAYALRQREWKLSTISPNPQSAESIAHGYLDDSANPLIRGRSSLANAITSWEAGYLLYDTCAMIYAERATSSPVAATGRLSPTLLAHHVLLASALLSLQGYIARGKERGVWVIVAFLLMNASNPLLHARWWARRSGKYPPLLDIAFAAVFAASRFGTIMWVLRRYGAFHGLSPLAAYTRLRVPCAIGTAVLMGSNGLWWILLVKGILRRNICRPKGSA